MPLLCRSAIRGQEPTSRFEISNIKITTCYARFSLVLTSMTHKLYNFLVHMNGNLIMAKEWSGEIGAVMCVSMLIITEFPQYFLFPVRMTKEDEQRTNLPHIFIHIHPNQTYTTLSLMHTLFVVMLRKSDNTTQHADSDNDLLLLKQHTRSDADNAIIIPCFLAPHRLPRRPPLFASPPPVVGARSHRPALRPIPIAAAKASARAMRN